MPRFLGRFGDAVVLPHRGLSQTGRRQYPAHAAGFIQTRGGVSLRPGDGIIHSWLNRMLLPDQWVPVGLAHPFPHRYLVPAGSGLVAFAAATGVIR